MMGKIIILFSPVKSASVQVIIPEEIKSSEPIVLQVSNENDFFLVKRSTKDAQQADENEEARSSKCSCGRSYHKGSEGLFY